MKQGGHIPPVPPRFANFYISDIPFSNLISAPKFTKRTAHAWMGGVMNSTAVWRELCIAQRFSFLLPVKAANLSIVII